MNVSVSAETLDKSENKPNTSYGSFFRARDKFTEKIPELQTFQRLWRT